MSLPNNIKRLREEKGLLPQTDGSPGGVRDFALQ